MEVNEWDQLEPVSIPRPTVLVLRKCIQSPQPMSEREQETINAKQIILNITCEEIKRIWSQQLMLNVELHKKYCWTSNKKAQC